MDALECCFKINFGRCLLAISRLTWLAGATVVLVLGGAAVYGVMRASAPAGGNAVVVHGKIRATEPHWRARVAVHAGLAPAQTLDDPFGLVGDSAGNLYLAEGGEANRVVRIGSDGVVTLLAGGKEGFSDGTGAAAALHTPSGLAIDAAGNLYVADTGNNAIRKISPQGVVSTLAGDGIAGDQDGQGAAARFNGPVGIALDRAGVVYVSDTYNDRIRKITPDGMVSTLAGGKRNGMVDGAAAEARFDLPTGLVVAPDGTLLIADTGNDAIRRLGPDGMVSTIAAAPEDDRVSLLRAPVALALTHDGYLYLASQTHGRVAQITPQGEVLALEDADHPAQPGYGADGGVRLHAPRGMALAADGSLYLSDSATRRLYHVAPAGSMTASTEPPVPLPVPGARTLWPVAPQDQPHEVVGLMGEVRGSFKGENRHHFHSGLDVQAAIGTPVLAVVAAKVSNPAASWSYGDLSEGLALGEFNYIHMRVGRDAKDKVRDARFLLQRDEQGKPVALRVRRGTRFGVGETLGSVNRMAHVHLDYRPAGEAVNPLTLPFTGLRDTIAPQIQRIALADSRGQPLTAKQQGRLLLPRSLGGVQIIVDAFDQMDGNQARRRLGLYQLGYQLLDRSGQPLAGMAPLPAAQTYDRLPRNREAVQYAYAPSSGITVHGAAETRFSYALHNTLVQGQIQPGLWQIGALAPGPYILRISARDYAGNPASGVHDLAVQVE
ncbi:gluconolaconase [Pseudoduganella sp. FT93W]|uniref:Gluconolaconase n=1 Tax=Duganella fentianensis TaxID=2692177 RepID=A0A845I2L1_9BURK|nr:gluconolaconase [Duganella fentianensis]